MDDVMKEAREAAARAMMLVNCVVPGSNGLALPVLSGDPDFDELPANASEGVATGPDADMITQEAVRKLADAAISAYEAKLAETTVRIPHPRTMTRARASAYITIILRHCGPEAGEDESAMDGYLAEARALLAATEKE